MPQFVKRAPPRKPQDLAAIHDTVREMIDSIRDQGDDAVRAYAAKLDKWDEPDFRVSEDRIRETASRLPETFKEDFAICLANVRDFAKRQRDSISEFEAEIAPGVLLGQKLVPINRAGCYIPGGKYPLISAAAMSVATARVAGVGHIIGCAPPRPGENGMYPQTLYALHASGADDIYCIGGVQAMASMAFGRVGMAPVDIITGPGNPYVAEAKRQLFGMVGIDLPAGPTEVCVLCDGTADAELVATDILGQAEHGPDSPAWVVTTSAEMGAAVLAEIERQLKTLPTGEMAGRAWRDLGEIVVAADRDEAVRIVDDYAPEHLEIQTAEDDWYLQRIRNYGSAFVGAEATVAYGDKGVGTNHTLPTGRAARYTGGLWVGKFIKTMTWQRLSRAASHDLAGPLGRICREEGMLAHAITCDVRGERYRGENRETETTT
ncbi:histidinol dehydrogenase [Pikeienuella sp. HZG-20]|uniref:histidinol dehydrogenase n=1 Tax=Paludibacillus litoralis TaxID=3133267 RepID=UPI0030EE1458